MGRMEFLPAYYRDADGRVQERPMPRGEPDPYDVPADLYFASYEVKKGLFGPARVENLEITIFNTRTYRPDPALEDFVKDRLVERIAAKEGAELVQSSGGLVSLKSRIEVDTWWRTPGEH